MARLPAATRATILRDLISLGSNSADDAVLAGAVDGTGRLRVPLAQVVSLAVEAALDALESNRMIAFTIPLGEVYEYRVSARGGPSNAEVPEELRAILEVVYQPEGVETWWRGRNVKLHGAAPEVRWNDPGGREQVMALAESLLGQVAT